MYRTCQPQALSAGGRINSMLLNRRPCQPQAVSTAYRSPAGPVSRRHASAALFHFNHASAILQGADTVRAITLPAEGHQEAVFPDSG